jgi:hypothetical protein
VSGRRYAIPFDIDNDSTELARDIAFARLVHENWLVEKKGNFGIEVYGVRAKGEGSDPIKSLVVIARKENGREIAKLGSTGKATAELREGDGVPAKNPPALGPALGAESYVEFDFTSMPCEKGPWELVLTVETTLKNFSAIADPAAPDGIRRDALCENIVASLEDIGFRAEVVEKSKVRVYGGIFDGKFRPAARGTAESQQLKREHLPKVANPPKA